MTLLSKVRVGTKLKGMRFDKENHYSWDDPVYGEVIAKDDNSITIHWRNYVFEGRGPATSTYSNKRLAEILNSGSVVITEDGSRSANQNSVVSSARDNQIRANNEKVFARLGLGASR